MKANIEIAVKHFGSTKKLADALGLTAMAVTQWRRRGLPPFRAKQIADLSNGAIKKSDLLPDLFD